MLMNAVSFEADHIASQLRSRIEEGGNKPGDRIESERELIVRLDVTRTRLSLEPAIAREAALHTSQAAVRQLKESCDRAVNAPTWDEYETQDDNFHRALAKATENVLLFSLFDHLNAVRRAVTWNTVVRRSVRPDRTDSSFAEHDAIGAAIEAREPSAAHTAMRSHPGSVVARLFGEA